MHCCKSLTVELVECGQCKVMDAPGNSFLLLYIHVFYFPSPISSCNSNILKPTNQETLYSNWPFDTTEDNLNVPVVLSMFPSFRISRKSIYSLRLHTVTRNLVVLILFCTDMGMLQTLRRAGSTLIPEVACIAITWLHVVLPQSVMSVNTLFVITTPYHVTLRLTCVSYHYSWTMSPTQTTSGLLTNGERWVLSWLQNKTALTKIAFLLWRQLKFSFGNILFETVVIRCQNNICALRCRR